MQRLIFLPLLGLLVSCASMSRGHIYTVDDEAIAESTYVYGYAILGTQYRFILTFENAGTGEWKVYEKSWSTRPIYKEHIFAFSLPEGAWRLANIATFGDPHGSYQFPVNKQLEIKKGKGNFIGKLNVENAPIDAWRFDDVQMIRDKEKTDLLMKEKYPGFEAYRTVLVEYK